MKSKYSLVKILKKNLQFCFNDSLPEIFILNWHCLFFRDIHVYGLDR